MADEMEDKSANYRYSHVIFDMDGLLIGIDHYFIGSYRFNHTSNVNSPNVSTIVFF